MEHIDFSVLPTGQLIDKLDGILIQLTQPSPKQTYCDSNTNTLRWVEDIYLLLTAQRLAEEIINGLQSDNTTLEYSFSYLSAAKLFHADKLGWDLYATNYVSPSSLHERVPFLPWLDQDVSVDSMLSEDKLNRYTLIHELNDKLSTCRNLSLLTIGGYIDSYSRSHYLLQVQKAQRDYNEAKDRCKSTEWEDRKLKMKNENIDNIKVNHFGKFFYDYAAYPDKRYSYALINNFPHASIQYIEEGVTNIYSKIEEFCYLQALYCLLHDEDPIPPEFRKQEPAPQLEKETQKADSTAKKKEPDNYTAEERLKIINCYKGLANFMTIDTHWITDIFKPNDDNLWAAIKTDGQTPLMHPNRNDGTNIAPLLNLLGVLCYTKKLSNKPSSYYNKLSEQLTHLDKNRIASLVKNGNRKELRGLANTIKKRLDKMTEQ
jgi:hypothetical protein